MQASIKIGGDTATYIYATRDLLNILDNYHKKQNPAVA